MQFERVCVHNCHTGITTKLMRDTKLSTHSNHLQVMSSVVLSITISWRSRWHLLCLGGVRCACVRVCDSVASR